MLLKQKFLWAICLSKVSMDSYGLNSAWWLAQDRERWRQLVETATLQPGARSWWWWWYVFPAADQPTVSKHWRHLKTTKANLFILQPALLPRQHGWVYQLHQRNHHSDTGTTNTVWLHETDLHLLQAGRRLVRSLTNSIRHLCFHVYMHW